MSPSIRADTGALEKPPEMSRGGPKGAGILTSIDRRQKQIPDQESEDTILPSSEVQDAFGSEDGAAIQYKTLHWWHTGVLMIAENISLGVLALPQATATLGLVPGLLLILILGSLAGYTGYIIGQFKEIFPQVTSYADMGDIIGGAICRRIFAAGALLILVFICAAHVLSFSIAMNVLTDHGQCTTVFMAVGMIVCFVLGLPRTFKGVSFLSIFSCFSVIIAVTIAMASIAVAKPDMGNIVAVASKMPLVEGLNPVMNIILAYTGHVAFPGFLSEMENPRDFPKALAMMQSVAVTFYMLISIVIYYYAGPHVASPALASAPEVVRKISFGIAIPTIVIAGVVNGSVACKYLYLRAWRGTDVIHQKSFKSIGSWVGICAGVWIVSWLIAEVIPKFSVLLGMIGALFGSWMSYGIPGVLWLYMNKGCWFSTRSKSFLTMLNFGLFILGFLICTLGMWSSGWELARGAAGKVFSCDNNWKPSY